MIGVYINKFDALASNTVKDFNKIFTDCPLLGHRMSDEVSIGEILGPDYVRLVKVGEKEVKHIFNVIDDLFKPDQPRTAKKPPVLVNFPTNPDKKSNAVMTAVEMAMNPMQYKLLQYVRGSKNRFHTLEELQENLNIHERTIRKHLTEMKTAGIIKYNKLASGWRVEIILQGEFAV